MNIICVYPALSIVFILCLNSYEAAAIYITVMDWLKISFAKDRLPILAIPFLWISTSFGVFVAFISVNALPLPGY